MITTIITLAKWSAMAEMEDKLLLRPSMRYEVYVGAGSSGEVDFVADRQNERLYIQVSSNIVEGKTLERELKSLEAIHDSFPKIVLTRDSLYWGMTKSGIAIRSLIGWLLDDAR